jgi:hypothetical protein
MWRPLSFPGSCSVSMRSLQLAAPLNQFMFKPIARTSARTMDFLSTIGLVILMENKLANAKKTAKRTRERLSVAVLERYAKI